MISPARRWCRPRLQALGQPGDHGTASKALMVSGEATAQTPGRYRSGVPGDLQVTQVKVMTVPQTRASWATLAETADLQGVDGYPAVIGAQDQGDIGHRSESPGLRCPQNQGPGVPKQMQPDEYRERQVRRRHRPPSSK